MILNMETETVILPDGQQLPARDRQVQMLREELEDEKEKTRLRQKHMMDTRTETVAVTTTQDWTDAVLRYSLQMDDPAVDVVTDFSNCVILEPKLTSIDSVGNPRVSTTTELFYVTNEKSKDLNLILSQPAAGSSLESRLMKYRIAFHSQKRPGKLTMLTCLVRAVETHCLEQEQKLIAALKVAATMVHSDRAEVGEDCDISVFISLGGCCTLVSLGWLMNYRT